MKKLMIVASYLVFFVLGGLTFTSLTSSEAAVAKKFNVTERTVNYYVDNVKKTPPKGQTAFLYEGSTYVPLRFLVEAMGEELYWDGKTSSAYIGGKPQGKITYLQDLEPHTVTGDGKKYPEIFVTNMGEEFSHSSFRFIDVGVWGSTSNYDGSLTYLANGKFKTFEAYLAPHKNYKGTDRVENIGSLKIYADDELVYDSGRVASDITKKIKVSADIEGASEVRFEVSSAYNLGLLDAKFIH